MAGLYVMGGIAVLCVVLLWLVFPACRRHPARERMKGMFIAHRGLHGVFENTPENSLAAFSRAAENGFAIENDVHLTADGEVVVFHDYTLTRMCGVDGTVEQSTLAELKKLRLAGTAEQIPTLRECLDVIKGRVPLLIEFKTESFKNCGALCRAVDKILADYDGEYYIQSFFPGVLLWYRRHRKDVCRGQLSTDKGMDTLPKKLLSTLVFNFLGRPDFVSYDHRGAANFFRVLTTHLGAFPVGWTFRNKSELARHRDDFECYIFEDFIPDKEKK